MYDWKKIKMSKRNLDPKSEEISSSFGGRYAVMICFVESLGTNRHFSNGMQLLLFMVWYCLTRHCKFQKIYDKLVQ